MRIDLPEPYNKMKRAPQVILPKDIGIIIAYSGVNRESVCVDAGTGSGWLAVGLARIAKKVISYELREDFIKIAEKNKAMENLQNLEIRHGDITKDLKEKNVDIITLVFFGYLYEVLPQLIAYHFLGYSCKPDGKPSASCACIHAYAFPVHS